MTIESKNDKLPTAPAITYSECYAQPFFNLLFGDGFQLIKSLPDNSVDLIVTDPPYGINLTKGYKSGSTELVQGDDGFTVMLFFILFMSECTH